MQNLSKSKTVIFMSLVVIAICCFLFYYERTSLQEIILIFTALVGAVSIWYEMKRSKDMAEGEFILTLNESFSQNDDLKSLYKKLVAKDTLTEQDVVAIVEYLTFFETIYVLIRKGVVDLKLVDDLFGYRFFLAITNEQIQAFEIIVDAKHYRNIYTLDYLWREYRNKHSKPIIMGTPLSEANKDYLQYVEVKK